jgi:hypothetical protein
MWMKGAVLFPPLAYDLQQASLLHLVAEVRGEQTSRGLLTVEIDATIVVLEEDRYDCSASRSWRLVSLSEAGRQSRV